MTVGEWFATYLDQVGRPKIRPRTFDRYSADVTRHILPAIGRHRLDKLRPAHLVELYNAKAAEGLSGASVRHIHAVIRRALNVAVRWQLIAVNPANLVDAPKAAQHEVTPLSAVQSRRLIREAEHDRMAARWLIGLALGLRQDEALGLWWEDIDLQAGLLRVRRALQRQRGGGLVFTAPKTARSKRSIPLPGQLVHALEDHQARQEKERIAAGSLWRGSLCVFTTPVGTLIDPRNDYREFKKLLGNTGLPPVRLHDLRHTAASLLVAQGVPPRVVMEILGHSQIALTMNTYSHVAPEVSREAANRIAETLWQNDEDQAEELEATELGTANEGRCCSPCCSGVGLEVTARFATPRDLGTSWWGARGSNPEPTD